MPDFQGSFEDRIGKYIAGDTLIQKWGDYDPNNPLITKAGSTAFIAEVHEANSLVTKTKLEASQKKSDRRPLCFTQRDPNREIGIINPDCAEQRIVRVHSYLAGLLQKDSTTVDMVATILKKIRPDYKRATSKKSFSIAAGRTITISSVVSNAPALNTGSSDLSWQEVGSENPPVFFKAKAETMIHTPSGKIEVKNLSGKKRGRVRLLIASGKKNIISPSEKTFAGIPGFLSEVITLVSGLDIKYSYNPPDDKLQTDQLSALLKQIEAAGSDVTASTDNYGSAVRERRRLYEGEEGMLERIRLTKSYLGSFSGGKKSGHFIEYSQALKGN